MGFAILLTFALMGIVLLAFDALAYDKARQQPVLVPLVYGPYSEPFDYSPDRVQA